MNLGDVIRQYREKNEMSQAEFAKISGISKGYVSMLENNKNPSSGKPIVPTYRVFKAVADVLHVKPQHLIEMMDEDQMIEVNRTSVALEVPPDDLLQGLEDRRIHFTSTAGIHPLPDVNQSAPASDDAEALSVEEVMEAFYSAGLVPRGQDLTDEDLRFLLSVVAALRQWFGGESGK